MQLTESGTNVFTQQISQSNHYRDKYYYSDNWYWFEQF